MANKPADKLGEILRVLDDEGKWTGFLATREDVHKNKWHYNNVAIFIFDTKSKSLLLEKRSINKMNNPGKWAIVGGHVSRHEDILSAAINEVNEEIGISLSPKDLTFLTTIKPEKDRAAFTHVFYVMSQKKITKFKREEIVTGRNWMLSELTWILFKSK
jgi:8-oxo-dGTP pyrophosphatase MutT (NUDIX family)